MEILALYDTALLFGGMVLYSAGLAPLLFSTLPAAEAGRVLRVAFPWYYAFCGIVAALGMLAFLFTDLVSAALMAVVALVAVSARQALMPAINAASDSGARSRFRRLHGLSVALNFGQLALISLVLWRLA